MKNKTKKSKKTTKAHKLNANVIAVSLNTNATESFLTIETRSKITYDEACRFKKLFEKIYAQVECRFDGYTSVMEFK